tara:strand:+ start:546 stop:773 length:228 start_codon:yes stop_codon:yes gene_type:complete
METITNNKEYKTPSYMRRSYKTYYDKNKDTDDFKEKRRLAQRKYYEKNKEKVLEKLRAKRALLKETSSDSNTESE